MSFIIIGTIFIPLFILYNFYCRKNKKISMWVDGGKLKVSNDNYFTFQFNNSLLICLMMAVFMIYGFVSKLNEKYAFLMVVFFYVGIYLTKSTAIKKKLLTYK